MKHNHQNQLLLSMLPILPLGNAMMHDKANIAYAPRDAFCAMQFFNDMDPLPPVENMILTLYVILRIYRRW